MRLLCYALNTIRGASTAISILKGSHFYRKNKPQKIGREISKGLFWDAIWIETSGRFSCF
jgi:hypothetical protein